MSTGSEPTVPGPGAGVATTTPGPLAPGLSGGLLGAWRLLRPIGEGGMGVVWLAERADKAFERQAAVKIIRPGFDSAAVHQRFLLERQTQGALEHPHIARLLDAGSTDDGRPYFVMEFVDGMPIDDWCRDRALGLAARVALFLQVCDAVQYAHGRLVVHRDIKPGNILVDREGQVRLLDFGIAKLLPEGDGLADAGLTSASERLLTPQYAAPEQLMGEPVGITTDVYALGMLLYSLLADVLPYSLAGTGPAQMQRLVCDEMPPRPSSRIRDARRARALRGDLDLITLMALRKEPGRRYQTVEQFAADLRRWRNGLPVLAQPDTPGYRLRKFAGRNRFALGSAALVFLSLVGGIAASAWQAHEAGLARDLAQQRYRDVRSLATNMMFEVDGAIATLPGSVHARRLVVSRALGHLDRLSREMDDDPALLADVATGYEKIADIQGSPFEFNLGDGEAALANARRALALRERASRLLPPDDAAVAALARSWMQLGTMIRQAKGREDEAQALFAKALALLASRPAKATDGGALGLAHADALNLTGISHFARGEYAQASASHARALALADSVLQAPPPGDDTVAWRRTQAVSRLQWASARWWEGAKGDDVILPMQASVATFEALLAQSPGNARLIRQTAVSQAVLADVVGYERNVGQAQPHIARALALGEQLLTFDPGNAQTRRDMARWQSLAADHLQGGTYWQEASDHSLRALGLLDGLVADQPAQLDLWVERRAMRCKRAGLLLQGQRAGFASPDFSKQAVCDQALACRRDLQRKDLAAPDFNDALLSQVVETAGACPAR